MCAACVLVSRAEAQEPTITVFIYNRSHMRQQTLRDGEHIANDILLRAGLSSEWSDCLGETGEALKECGQPTTDVRVVLTIVKHWNGPVGDGSRLGLAIQNPPGQGVYCYVFQERLDQLVRDTHIDPSRLLGHAIAHEIGHLLKGSDSHSPEGIMSAQWYGHHIDAMKRGAMGFTPEDMATIRTKMATWSNAPTVSK
jgi:hypothetical protein